MSETTVLYRVQSAIGQGFQLHAKQMWCYHIYNLSDGTERFMHPDCDHSLYPYIAQLKEQPDRWLFGFATQVHLLLWLRLTELGRLANQGFETYEICVPTSAVRYGSRQVIFEKESVIQSNPINISSLEQTFKQHEDYLRSMHMETFNGRLPSSSLYDDIGDSDDDDDDIKTAGSAECY